jgi:hypothetical protein
MHCPGKKPWSIEPDMGAEDAKEMEIMSRNKD